MMNNRKQSGFTLVEIAIVLVIIGLLLGGILKGQQLINSARVRNMADQNSGVQAAYYGFIDRYRQVPGDMLPAAACQSITANIANCGAAPYAGATIGGNQNGRIDSWPEAGAVWGHLSSAGFLNGSFTGNTPAFTHYELGVPGGVVPGNAFTQPIFLGYSDDYDSGGAATVTVRLMYTFGAGSSASLLRELDVKLDDGQPGTGVVRATVANGATRNGEVALGGADLGGTSVTAGQEVILWNSGFGATCVTGPNAAGATWNVDSDNVRCNAAFIY